MHTHAHTNAHLCTLVCTTHTHAHTRFSGVVVLPFAKPRADLAHVNRKVLLSPFTDWTQTGPAGWAALSRT